MRYSNRYTCQQGDVLDEICNRHYGTETDTTELVLAANYDLTRFGTHLPVGLVIILPIVQEDDRPPVAAMTKLWD